MYRTRTDAPGTSVGYAAAVRRLHVLEDEDGRYVRVLQEDGWGLIGHHWELTRLRAHLRVHPIEVSGRAIASQGYGLTTAGPYGGRLFIATSPG